MTTDQITTDVEFSAKLMQSAIDYDKKQLVEEIRQVERHLANITRNLAEGIVWEELNLTTAAASVARRTASIKARTEALAMLTAVINDNKEN